MTARMFEPTPQQKRCLSELERSLAVSAGAGSGKTRVLVERYLNLVALGHGPETVLAITFTEKAANEMKDRARRLAAGTRLAWPGLADAHIQTFHSLCAWLLRDNAVEAGVDPRFRVLDEAEAAVLLEEAVALALAGGGAAQRLWEVMPVFRWRGILSGLFNQIRGAGLSPKDGPFAKGTSAQAANEPVPAVRRAADKLVASVRSLLAMRARVRPQTRTAAVLQTLAEAWPELEARLASSAEPAEVEYACARLSGLFPGNATAEVREAVDEAKEAFDELCQELVDQAAAKLAEDVTTVLAAVEDFYRLRKARLGALDFADLELLTLAMLRKDPSVRRRYGAQFYQVLVDEYQDTNAVQQEIVDLIRAEDAVFFAVGDAKQSIYRFRGADVEVFQKTRAQLAAKGQEVVLLDNFRTLEPIISFINYVFARVMGSAYEPLAARRSRARTTATAATATAAATAARGWGDGLDTAAYDGAGTGACSDAGVGPLVELVLTPKGRENEAVVLARRLREMVIGGEVLVEDKDSKTWRPVRYGDIAVLFRALTTVAPYEEALREMNVPYFILAGSGFFERPEIQDAVHFLRFTCNPTDDLALAVVLRNVFRVSEDALWLLRNMMPGAGARLWDQLRLSAARELPLGSHDRERLRLARELLRFAAANATRWGPDEATRFFLDQTGYLKTAGGFPDGPRRLANLAKLRDLALEARGRGESVHGFAAYVEEYERREIRESEAQAGCEGGDTVKLLTVHRAKGLEWPVVVVADLSRPVEDTVPPFLFSPETGLVARHGSRRPPGKSEGSRQWQALRAAEREAELAESKRVFYVATTRARDYLLLSAGVSPVSPPPGDEEDEGEGEERPKKASHRALRLSWLTWLLDALETTVADVVEAGEPGLVHEKAGVRLRYVTPPAFQALAEISADPALAEVAAVEGTRGPAMNEGCACVGSAVSDEAPAAAATDIARTEGRDAAGHGGKHKRPMQERPYSVTELLTYLACPRRYYYRYRLFLPEARESWERDSWEHEEETSLEPGTFSPSAATLGILVHGACERLRDENGVEEALEEAAVAAGLFGAEWRTSLLPRARAMVQRYAGSWLFAELRRAERVENELSFLANVGGRLVQGILDKVAFADGGRSCLIVDFKTNKIGDDRGLLAKLTAWYGFQLGAYAIGMQNAGYIVKGAYLYFLDPDVTASVDTSPAACGATREKLLRIMAALEEGGGEEDFTRNASACHGCPYKDICRPPRA